MNIKIKDLDTSQTFDLETFQYEYADYRLQSQQWISYWDAVTHSHHLLCEAAQNNDLQQLQTLLNPQFEFPIDINFKLEEQWCALHYASLEGHISVIQILLSNGAKSDVTNVHKRTPLHIACIKGYRNAVEVLFPHSNPNAVDFDGNTVLHLASQLSHHEIVKVLIGKVDHSIRNNCNYTAYQLATDPEILKIFQSHGLADQRVECNRQLPTVTVPNLRKANLQTCLKDFQVLGQIGRGAFGSVYMVKHRDTKNVFAMKLLSKMRVEAANLTEYVKTERNVLSFVQSPFIVKLHYAFQTQNKLYLVMDYCPGGDLEDLLKKKGAFPEKVLKCYTSEVVLAIEALHKSCIVYRDLKPSNIVIAEDGHIKLTDFGLAKELKQGKTTQSFCGSVSYLAPEMLSKKGHAYPLDWYLLGVLMYELSTGQPPFYHDNRDKMFSNIKDQLPKQPDNMSNDLWDLIQKLLTKNPSQRLGANRDSEDIKAHKWFHDVDFEKVKLKMQPMPKVPMHNEENPSDLMLSFSYSNDCSNRMENWSFKI